MVSIASMSDNFMLMNLYSCTRHVARQNCSIVRRRRKRQLYVPSIITVCYRAEDSSVVPYDKEAHRGFWGHVDPARLGVPRYQNIFRIVVWFIFLFAYSQAGTSYVSNLLSTSLN